MRRLLLIRHAKSSWDFSELDDHDRPLNPRGTRNSTLMAERLFMRQEVLDAVITSSALRALGIAEPIARRLHAKLIEDPELYTFSSKKLKQRLLCLPNNHERLAIVSHNPAITQVATDLSKRPIDNIPTSGVIAFNCDIQYWDELSSDTCYLDYFDYPKQRFSANSFSAN